MLPNAQTFESNETGQVRGHEGGQRGEGGGGVIRGMSLPAESKPQKNSTTTHGSSEQLTQDSWQALK